MAPDDAHAMLTTALSTPLHVTALHTRTPRQDVVVVDDLSDGAISERKGGAFSWLASPVS